MHRRSFHLWPGWIAAIAAVLLAGGAHADPADDWQKSQAFNRSLLKTTLDNTPTLDPNNPSRPPSDVLSLKIEKNVLVLRTALPSTQVTNMGNRAKLKLGDGKDWALLSIVGGAANGQPIAPSQFMLQMSDFEPDQTRTFTVQQIGAVVLAITLQTQTLHTSTLIQFQEQFPNAIQPGAGNCELVTMDFSATAPNKRTPVTYQSPNFFALTREHPAEVDRYLQPLFHELGQQSVLAPDPMLAFEVFSARWKADPQMSAKVNALLPDLGAPAFRSRTAAEKKLAALGKDAVLVLMRLDRTKLTPEQLARVDSVLAPYLPMPVKDIKDLAHDPVFLLDCLYCDDMTMRKAALAQLQLVANQPLKFDPTADAVTRAPAISALLQQLIATKVIVAKS